MTLQTLFQNTIILRKPGVANFTNIIKITITLFQQLLKVKTITNYVLKFNFYQFL